MGVSLSKLANPDLFLRISRIAMPIAGVSAVVLLGIGVYLAFWGSPPDFRQGEAVRIMYIHVPAATMSMGVYAMIAVASFVGFVWRHRLADVIAREVAPLGTAFAALTLFTGSLWGKATWGVYWDWDPRLTSMLVLLFLYIGYMVIWRAIEHEAQAARIAALLAMIGAINLPIIKYSVDWWDSLHQKTTLFNDTGGPSLDGHMLAALLVMMSAYGALTAFYVMIRTRSALLRRRIEQTPTARPSAAFLEPAE